MKILIIGLSGAGKSELAKELHSLFQANKKSSIRINGDEVREANNDWDFSPEGRIRQAERIAKLTEKSDASYTIVDFIAPKFIHRHTLDATIVIWMDTVKSSKYKDTDVLFEPPLEYNYRITKKNASKWAQIIYKDIKNKI